MEFSGYMTLWLRRKFLACFNTNIIASFLAFVSDIGWVRFLVDKVRVKQMGMLIFQGL